MYLKRFAVFLAAVISLVTAWKPLPLGDHQPCVLDPELGSKGCLVDGYIGSEVIYEDERVRVWNFTLAPGQMTSMHRHDHDYHFVAIHPTQLEVWGESGEVLFSFRAEGTLGFKVEGDFLIPISDRVPLPPVPRTHAAKNIGDGAYYEIIFESKTARESIPDNEL